jgi:hypothetical protein
VRFSTADKRLFDIPNPSGTTEAKGKSMNRSVKNTILTKRTRRGKKQTMSTPIIDRDLTKQAPHSPRERIAGFAIAKRTIDKCRASLAATLGEYHYDCPLDNLLFSFKGINGEQFKAAVRAAKTYEEIESWLQENGTKRTPAEIKAWSDEVEADSPLKNPEKRAHFIENCVKLGLNPETSTTFDWLEADDRASFQLACAC